jgi:hypothetical protein
VAALLPRYSSYGKLRLTEHIRTSTNRDDSADSIEDLRAERDELRRDLAKAEIRLRLAKANALLLTGECSSDEGGEFEAERVVGVDYGFQTKSMGFTLGEKIVDTGPPRNAFSLASATFSRELAEIFGRGSEASSLTPRQKELQSKLSQVRLSNDAIWRREGNRPPVKSPLVVKLPYLALCYLLDAFFKEDPISRFWFLEVQLIPSSSSHTFPHFLRVPVLQNIGLADLISLDPGIFPRPDRSQDSVLRLHHCYPRL